MSGPLTGPFAALKQPPRSRTGVSSQEYARWLDDLWRILSSYPGISWEQIDFTGITINPTVTMDHSQLGHVFGADDSGHDTNFSDPAHVRHVSNAQATAWTDSITASQNAAENALAQLAMTGSTIKPPASDTQALQWM